MPKSLISSFFLISYLALLTRAWQEWTDQNAVPSSTVSTRLYASGVSFISWTEAEANNLCPSNQCGPYCNSTCSSTTTRNIAVLPDPSGDTTGLSNSDAGCPDNCCSTENCLRTLNSNGDNIGINKEYVLIFGGREVTAASSSTLLFDECELDFFQVQKDGTCQGTPKNDLRLVDIDGNVIKPVVPTFNSDLYTSAQIPSARYGHRAAIIERLEFDVTANINITRKYMFVYGGYSPACSGYCNDLWRYEIPWAAQRYYPQGSGYWKRGNYWEKLTTPTTPGRRAWFSLASDNKEYLYLFGGAKEVSGTRSFTNDLWRYSFTNNTWDQLPFKRFVSVLRQVKLWNGNTVVMELTPTVIKEGDGMVYNTVASSDCVTDENFPACRAFSSMNLDNDTNRLILSGGLNPQGATKNYKKSIWSFDIRTQVWSLLVNDSDTLQVPGSTAFASNSYLKGSSYRFQFYFGGIISETERRDSLWAYNFVLNKSVELVKQPLSDTQTYPRLNKGMVIVRLNQHKGLFLFGGYLKQDLSIALQTSKTTSLTNCQTSVTTNGLRWSDAFTSAWAAKYTTTNDTCFANVPDWLTAENYFTINNKMWIYLESYCRVADPAYGSCFWGRSKCNEGLYGDDCSKEQCPNSMCSQEKSSLRDAVCIHCFGRGTCVDGECQCEEGYTFDDCSGTDCPNNCSNTADETVATCNLMYPLSVCECLITTKRGGDDCSYIFCLNDCGGHGECEDGACTCDENYYGTDCSIFDIDFIEESSAVKGLCVTLVYMIVLNVITVFL